MNPKILVIGSTGKLGKKLLLFCFKNNIPINSIVCKKNHKQLINQAHKYNIKYFFCISKDEKKYNYFLKKNKFDIIYFLDHGSNSLTTLSNLLFNQKRCTIAVANKEMLISGGRVLIKSIHKSNNYFVPLDSEHFSLINNNINNDQIANIFITASGGPFYFDKKINFKKVPMSKVLSHPKWKMGINNLIDSSNFVNKLLEVFELSSIYNIDVKKINFVISPNAYLHSIVLYKDHVCTFNCFKNDMIITLIKPLTKYYDFSKTFKYKLNFDKKNFYFETPKDNRFKIIKCFNKLKLMSHSNQIEFMILNNLAQKLYLQGKITYSDIIDFILKKINFKNTHKLNSLNSIIKYIYSLEQNHNVKNS